MMNGLEPQFENGTGRQKGRQKVVDETHPCYGKEEENFSTKLLRGCWQTNWMDA